MYPNSDKNRMMGAQMYNSGPLTGQPAQAPQAVMPGKGMGAQLGDMAKQKAMSTALEAGGAELTGALGSSALGASAMTAMPYVGAGLLAGKALGLFNEGGQVGPLSMKYYTDMYNKYFPTKDMKDMGEPPAFSDRGVVIPNIQPDTGMPTGRDMQNYKYDLERQSLKDIAKALPQYKSHGGMTEADAIALMNNQASPDQLYDEIIMEQVGPLARPQIRDPYGADRTHSPYDMIRPDNAPNT